MISFKEISSTPDEKVLLVVGAQNEFELVPAEYEYLAKIFGPRDTAWKLDIQELISKDGRKFDTLHIVLSDGSKKTVSFDITDSFGKIE